MHRRMTVKEMMKSLKNETINTWFDLGLFIDRVKESRPIPSAEFSSSFDEFKNQISDGGIGFVTFYYAVDGVTLEIEKYAKNFQSLVPDIPIHYIGGEFYPESQELIDPSVGKCAIPEMKSFDKWNLYKDFFHTKLQRGSKSYNSLIKKYWSQVLKITQKLGKYVEDNNIKLLYIVNVNSNPGNVSSAMANVLVSEYLGIPVINNNHDFYWEGGNKKVDIETKGLKPGPRDFFFKNSHVGEFFTLLEVLYPWESRSWMQVNINYGQTLHLIHKNGHNPANVTEIGTAVDVKEYQLISKRKKINAFVQFEKVLSRYKETPICYSADDVSQNKLVDKTNPRPILLGYKTQMLKNFLSENIVFLQPTRIVSRKKIAIGFKLISKMLNNKSFAEKFMESDRLKLTMLVTGPIPMGQHSYFETLVERFSAMLSEIDPKFRKKIFLGFLFSELDKDKFKKRFENPVGIPELYNIASLVLLPSETEGRGLPIIEACATGVPIFCRRYYPEKVYAEVIGEHLPEKDRLKVIEFDGININDKQVEAISRRVFYPHKYIEETEHNKKVVEKRYSLESLNKNIEDICYRLHLQLQPNNISLETAKIALRQYKKICNFRNADLKKIINFKSRQYLAGYGKLAFMLKLKSLIDPSYFRVEEQEIRGIAHNFAKNLIKTNPDKQKLARTKIVEFYNAVDNIFYYNDGNTKIRHDHSFSYRHRNTKHYPYQDFTIQELTGLINLLYLEIIQPEAVKSFDIRSNFFTDWNLALSQLTSSKTLAIDDREILIKKLKSNIPVAYFPGKFVKYELELFALQSIRARLKLSIEQELTEDILKKNFKKLAPVYIFAQEKPLGKWWTADNIIDYIVHGNESELKLLYDYQILKIIKTHQVCVGIHFPQLGELALNVLSKIKEQNGILISNRRNAITMTDTVNIDRFHIGMTTYQTTANILGIKPGHGYIQYAPAGVRTTLNYPTPVQTAYDFHQTLKSDLFKNLCDKLGEDVVFNAIKEDAEAKGSPIKLVLENLKNKNKEKDLVEYNYVSGVYPDGYPWNGVMARADLNNSNKWAFSIVSSSHQTKRVTCFVDEFEKEQHCTARIAWNGGYILNPELVGKLGLSEAYIGSPLGLLITNGEVKSAPLFNKPALFINKDGSIDIRKISASSGLKIYLGGRDFQFAPEYYNSKSPGNNPAFYDLMFNGKEIPGDGRVVIRLAGNEIKEVIKTKKGQKVQIIPVGLTLSLPADQVPKNLENSIVEMTFPGLENVLHAVEAGPMLVDGGKACIDMEEEGWKTQFSIKTQAARLDYTDMRGPKIAAGVDKNGNLFVVTINGRLRESVGATHIDMANIMEEFGMVKAMGFDPGGSSTLVVDGKTLNISPYNSNYERNPYSLPPEPRAVANAIIGYLKD